MRPRGAALALLAPAVAAGALFFIAGRASPPAQAATSTVNIGSNFFSNTMSSNCGNPCITNIDAGDTVHWVWIGSGHSTTSDGGSAQTWNSGVHDSGFAFDLTFDQAGTFSYHCSVHDTIMRGTIVVGPPPAPTDTPPATETPVATAPEATPTVTPTAPAPGATPTRTPAGLLGDANKDGRIDPIDAALALQYSAGIISSINPNADVNRDAQINALDALLILQYVAGLIGSLPP